jgi:hypothetical protein
MDWEQRKWLSGFLKWIVQKPDEVCIGTIRGGDSCGLEVIIQVSDVDRPLFDESILSLLAEEVASQTGVQSTMVHLKRDEKDSCI